MPAERGQAFDANLTVIVAEQWRRDLESAISMIQEALDGKDLEPMATASDDVGGAGTGMVMVGIVAAMGRSKESGW